MTIPANNVSRDALRALEDFSDEFRQALALGDVDQWAERLGLVRNTDALKSTFPIPISAAGYKELKGDIKFRSLFKRSLSMTSKEWSDGVEEKEKVITAPDFIDWAGQPSAMALEWMRHPNTLIANMLAEDTFNGPLLDFYRDEETGAASTRRLFATDHPFNVLDPDVGDFDNTFTTTVADIKSGVLFDTLTDHFRSIKGPNGQALGLRLTGGDFLVPGARESLFKITLETDTLIRAVTNVAGSENVAAVTQNNVYRGTFGYTVGDELTSGDYIYALAAGRPGLHPWIVQKVAAPEEILHDKTSEKYKTSRKVAIAYVGEANVAAALPHRIARIQITG